MLAMIGAARRIGVKVQSMFIRSHSVAHISFSPDFVHFNETRHGCCSTEIINIFPMFCHTGRLWSTLSAPP